MRRCNQADLQYILDTIEADFVIIPEPILKEVYRNQTPQTFNHLYQPFFSQLAGVKRIHILTFDHLFLLMNESENTELQALQLLHIFATQVAKQDPAIYKKVSGIHLRKKADLSKLETAMSFDGKNEGERFLALSMVVLIYQAFKHPVIWSEDKQPYFDRNYILKNETIHNHLGITNQGTFHTLYGLTSLEKMLLKTIEQKS